MKTRLVNTAFWLAWNAMWLIPRPVVRHVLDAISSMTVKRQRQGVRQLAMNIGRMADLADDDPRLAELTRDAFRSYLRYYSEVFTLPRWSKARVVAHVRAINAQGLSSAVAQGGAIIAAPHSGNWDWAAAWAAATYGPVATVAERLKPESLYRQFVRARQALGVRVAALTGDGSTYDFLVANLAQGHLVALLADRDITRTGIGVTFADHPTRLPAGPALLAIETGKPLFTCATHYDADTLVIVFAGPIPVDSSPCTSRERVARAKEVTQAVAASFETLIRDQPQAWHQMQPVWPDLLAAR
jgi:lauroyl/myristoyl acyltransferase